MIDKGSQSHIPPPFLFAPNQRSGFCLWRKVLIVIGLFILVEELRVFELGDGVNEFEIVTFERSELRIDVF